MGNDYLLLIIIKGTSLYHAQTGSANGDHCLESERVRVVYKSSLSCTIMALWIMIIVGHILTIQPSIKAPIQDQFYCQYMQH